MPYLPLAEAARKAGEADPITSRLSAPLSEAMTEIYQRLNWHPDRAYRGVNRSVGREWDWQNRSPPESVTALRVALAVDARLRVLVVHGAYDLVTPYFATKLILESIPDIGGPDRIRLLCLPAAHMAYSRDATRRALRDAGETMMAVASSFAEKVAARVDAEPRETSDAVVSCSLCWVPAFAGMTNGALLRRREIF